MDSQAGFEDDDDFFERYDAEQASQSLSALELDGDEPTAHSPEQLARSTRFRKPVAWFLGAMTLLSLIALGLRGSEPVLPAPSTHRELVAHYGSALPAATQATVAASAASAATVTSVTPEVPAAFEPVVWTAVCAAPSMCMLDSSAVAAWRSVPSTQSASVEESAVHLTHSGNARVHRPVHTSSIGARVAPGARSAPSVAVPKAAAAPAGFTSVARFPEDR